MASVNRFRGERDEGEGEGMIGKREAKRNNNEKEKKGRKKSEPPLSGERQKEREFGTRVPVKIFIAVGHSSPLGSSRLHLVLSRFLSLFFPFLSLSFSFSLFLEYFDALLLLLLLLFPLLDLLPRSIDMTRICESRNLGT